MPSCDAPECPWVGFDGDGQCLFDTDSEPQEYDWYVYALIKCAKGF